MTIWQIASGDRGRNYSRVFLDYDVMLIGPGKHGEYDKETYKNERMRNQIRAFRFGPKPGDLILLQHRRQVFAVGRIPNAASDQYQWNSAFSDVLGWDLQHCRRVIWSTEALKILDPIQPVFENFKQQPTFTRVKENRITKLSDQLDRLISKRLLKSLPVVPEPLSDKDLGIELFKAGVSNDSVEALLRVIQKMRRLCQWYRSDHLGKRPSESELVGHILSPLMASLGWSEQLLAVEWHNIDLAVFDQTPTNEKSCVIVCEAKRFGMPITEAFEQAQRYVKKLKLDRCKYIMTTDGLHLYLYRRELGKPWNDAPSGYVNFEAVRTDHLIPKNVSGVDTIVRLLPSRLHI